MQKFAKKKTGTKLGFRTSDHFKGKTLIRAKFNPSTFKTQHKG